MFYRLGKKVENLSGVATTTVPPPPPLYYVQGLRLEGETTVWLLSTDEQKG